MKIGIKDLLEAGTQFGHQTRKWNPKMKQYIFGSRNGIYIIDLQKTLTLLEEACTFLKGIAAKGGKVILVGTKKQAQEIIKQEAERCGAFYVNQRWLGGTMTNFATMTNSIAKLRDLETLFESEENLKKYSKKEQLVLSRKLKKLQKYIGGIKGLDDLPDAIFIVDNRKDKIALAEALSTHIPVVSMVDTNCNPDNIDYVIPANDDAVRSIQTIVGAIADAIEEGNAEWVEEQKKEAERKAKLEEERKALKAKEQEAKEKAAKEKAKTKAEEKAKEAPAEKEATKKAAVKKSDTTKAKAAPKKAGEKKPAEKKTESRKAPAKKAPAKKSDAKAEKNEKGEKETE